MRRHLGRLGNDGGIDLLWGEPQALEFDNHIAQQDPAVRVFVGRRAIGKMPADIPQARGAQQGIADGMQQGIGIGVAQEALLVRNRHSPENQAPALDQGMHIKALANPWPGIRQSVCRHLREAGKVFFISELAVGPVALYQYRTNAEILDGAGLIGGGGHGPKRIGKRR